MGQVRTMVVAFITAGAFMGLLRMRIHVQAPIMPVVDPLALC